jgi:hypothetical protein
MKRSIHVIGGGTVAHVRPHLAISAPAYGRTVQDIFDVLHRMSYDESTSFDGIVHLYTTRMAGNRHDVWDARGGIEPCAPLGMETNEDVAALLDRLVEDDEPKIIFLPAALVDFDVRELSRPDESESFDIGRGFPRLSSDKRLNLYLKPAEKIIRRVRRIRKDVFLVGFKTTVGASPQDQFDAGLRLVKQASCNLVLANDPSRPRDP